MALIGYARVSRPSHNIQEQLDLLEGNGCERIYREELDRDSGKRPQLDVLLSDLAAGDVLVVTSLDRLARSMNDLFRIVGRLEAEGAKLLSLSEPWANTTTPQGDQMQAVLTGLANLQRTLVSERKARGHSRTRNDGKPLGRPPKLTRFQKRRAVELKNEGKSNAEIARMFNVSRSTISRLS